MSIPGSGSPLLLASTAAAADAGYVIPKSLRFNPTDTASLSRTPSTAGNRRTWTVSLWLKRTKLGTNNQHVLETASSPEYSGLWFAQDDSLEFRGFNGSSYTYRLHTSQKFRDPSAWYHIVISFDSTASTSSDRLAMYVNGVKVTDFANTVYPSQNHESNWNNTAAHYIGTFVGSSNYYGGLIADVQSIDGQALQATDFGETRSSDGVWVPKEYTGPYGPNKVSEATGALPILNTTGDFGGTAASGTRTDSNSSSIEVAIAMNGSDDGTTFTDQSASIRGSGSALTVTASGSAVTSVDQSYFYGSSGYFPGTANSDCLTVAAGPSISSSDDFTIEYWYYQTGQPTTVGSVIRQSGTGASDLGIIHWGGNYAYYPTNTSTGVATVNNEWTHVAFTRESGTVRLFVNGVLRWSITGNTSTILNSSNSISIGSSGASYGLAEHFRGYLADVRIYGGVAKYTSSFAPPRSTGNGFHLNFSDSSTIEALGFDSAPTIPDADPKKGMDVITYTGNGGTQNIGGLNFEPGLIWIKVRDQPGDHKLIDSVRGASKRLEANTTDVEETATTGITSFNPDGFSLGSSGTVNGNNYSLVAWTWRAGGPAVSNSDGTITSQVSANTDYGFSIISYTGTGANATVGHGLTGQTPAFVIVKNRDSTYQWLCWHSSFNGNNYIPLNTNDPKQTNTAIWNNTSPTSSLINLGTNVSVNESSSDHIAYVWSEVSGYSKFSTYSGTGSTHTVDCGFRPAFLIIKSSTGSYNWQIKDNQRGDVVMFADTNAADTSDGVFDFTDNGFTVTGSGNATNASGQTYIFAAFADRPGNNWDVNNIVTNEGLSTSKNNFDVVTYSGTGSQQSISSLAFQPDLVWTKRRDGSSSHGWFDSVRGATKWLGSNSTNSEQTYSDSLTSFNSNGFTLGADTAWNGINQSSQTYVAWCWKAGGTAVSNTDGSITSSVSANAQYGFSIVSWDYDGTTGQYTVGHGLNTAPSMIIVRPREITSNWGVFHSSLGNTAGINLNQTNGSSTSTGWWNNTSPTNSVFTLSTFFDDNSEYIAYCFADVPGYQRFGSYTGNGSSTGPVIVTGFKPRFLLAKKTSASGRQWLMLDSQRNPRNPLGNRLYAENIAGDDSADIVNFVSNGFEIISATSDLNDSGATYIYWAIGDDEIGSEEDCLVDVPNAVTADADATDTTGGYQRGNYCTWNPLAVQPSGHGGFRDGNLEIIADTAGSHKATLATFALPSTGKWYWEVKAYRTGAINNGGGAVGVAEASAIVPTAASGNRLGEASSSSWTLGLNDFHARHANTVDYSGYLNGGSAEVDTGIIGVAVDMDNDKMWMHYNGVYGNAGGTGDPVGGANPMFSGEFAGKTLFPAAGITVDSGSGFLRANFGQMRFKYPIPSGYAALNTTALPAATIEDGSAQFDAVTYTGNGGGNGATQSIAGLEMSPDFVWLKSRGNTRSHHLFDTVRGAGKIIKSNATEAESTSTAELTAFTSDGWTLGDGYQTNFNNEAYVGWAWNAGSSTVSNTDGSITSSVRANPSAGFSIVTYSGNSTSGATIGHGLNAAPEFVVVKARNIGTQGWCVYHASLGATKYIQIDTTNAASTYSGTWNNTSPTNSVFTVGNDNIVNTGYNYVAYCFAPVAGYSAFGSYEGNGSSDGPFVYTGFKPAFLMWKLSSASGGHWNIEDNGRSPVNPVTVTLRANTNEADLTTSQGQIVDLLSNGFKVRNTSGQHNTSGATYIYMAFAENPFQANGGLAR